MTTIRRRVLVASTATAAGSLALASIVIYALVRMSLVAGFDADLVSRAEALASLVDYDDERAEFEFHAPDSRRQDMAFTIHASTGSVIASMGAASLLEALASPIGAMPHPESRILANGHRIRAFARTASLAPEESREGRTESRQIMISVVRETREMDRDLRQLAVILAVVGTGIALGSAVVLSFALQAALRPLKRIAADIAAINGITLNHRVAAITTPIELLPVVGCLNDLLDPDRTRCPKREVVQRCHRPRPAHAAWRPEVHHRGHPGS